LNPPPRTLEDALQELALVTALARRIHLDLCHSLDDFPVAHPMLGQMKERCDAFSKALGDTAAYRHELHEMIENLRLENQALRARLNGGAP
jgi:hypothetical protein